MERSANEEMAWLNNNTGKSERGSSIGSRRRSSKLSPGAELEEPGRVHSAGSGYHQVDGTSRVVSRTSSN